MEALTHTPLKPALFTAAVILINTGVLLGGVRKGIERLSNVLMPLLFVILLILCVVSLTLPGAAEGLRFFLEPDFSKLSPDVFVNALGQAFFSLSLGMGILITYASYYPATTKLPRTALIVSLLSLLVAVLMGTIIFPAVKTFGLDRNTLEGATLVFVTLPEVFSRLPFPQLWSTLFFALLLVAALTSTVSLSEVAVATLQDRLGWSRRRAVLSALLPLLVWPLRPIIQHILRLHRRRLQLLRTPRQHHHKLHAPLRRHRHQPLRRMVHARLPRRALQLRLHALARHRRHPPHPPLPRPGPYPPYLYI